MRTWRRWTAYLAVAVGLGLVPVANAQNSEQDKQRQTQEEARFEEFFKQRDTNGDGKLTAEEMSAGLDGAQAQRARQFFTAFDTDKDGAVTLVEAREFMTKVRSAMQEAEKKFTELDTNADEKVTLTEATIGKSGDELTMATEIFKKADGDGDGFITKGELRRVVFLAVSGQLQ